MKFLFRSSLFVLALFFGTAADASKPSRFTADTTFSPSARGILLAQNSSSQADYDKGLDSYAKGDYQAAIAAFSRVLRNRSTTRSLSNKTLLSRAKMYLAISQPMLAWSDLTKVAYDSPSQTESGELNLVKGVASIQLSQFKQAILFFSKAEKSLRGNSLLYSNRGVAYQALGDLPKARRDFKLSLSLKRDLPTSYNLAVLEREAKNFKACVDILTLLMQESDPNPAVFLQRGICLGGLGRIDEAVTDLLKSLAVDNNNPVTLEELASALIVKKETVSALKYLEFASAIYLRSGDSKEYMRLLEKIDSLR